MLWKNQNLLTLMYNIGFWGSTGSSEVVSLVISTGEFGL